MMASNPMQRKSRNAFLLGIIVTLLITGVVIALLLMMLNEKNEELKTYDQAKKLVYTLTQDVKAGQVLTQDMFALKSIHSESIPSNATATTQVIDSWFLQTKEGEAVCTDQYGLYLDRSAGDKKADTIIEVMENTKEASSSNVLRDEFGMFLVDTQGNDKVTRVYQEALTGEFYVLKIDTSALNENGTMVRKKEYVDIKNVPVLAKVDMNANTVVTSKLVVQSSEIVTDDTRQEEYNMITLPIDLMTNDYVDIRLKTTLGQNFIVVSKVQVEIPINADGSYVTDTIRVKLREDEILAMSSAIVEAYGLNGAELYVTKYVDPAMQEAAVPTYTPNAAVTAQIQANPNIVQIAKAELASRYSEASKKLRNDYLQQIINGVSPQEYNNNISTSVDESIGSSLSTRKKYLESLGY